MITDNNIAIPSEELPMNVLLQRWTDLVIALESCDMLDYMRKYDFTIDSHDAWVEFAHDEIEEVQNELKDYYGIVLHANCVGGTSDGLHDRDEDKKKYLDSLTGGDTH
jgi:hypothetical protein